MDGIILLNNNTLRTLTVLKISAFALMALNKEGYKGQDTMKIQLTLMLSLTILEMNTFDYISS